MVLEDNFFPIAVYAVTDKGKNLAMVLKKELKADVFLPIRFAEEVCDVFVFDSLMEVVRKNFFHYRSHIFITAVGIAVRCIAFNIRSKVEDPAVVVVDHNARFCISLLSGHMGGANFLAKYIGNILGAQPVITTATDVEGVVSIDELARDKGLFILNPDAIKHVSSSILEGEFIQVYDPERILELESFGYKVINMEDETCWNSDISGVWVHWRSKVPEKKQLVLHPKRLVLGIGCNKGTSKEKILDFIVRCFDRERLSIYSLKKIATVDIKKEEKGLIEVADLLKVPIAFFPSYKLEEILVPTPSETTRKHVGTKSVCEAAAILGANRGPLVLTKRKTKDVTIAVALDPLQW